MIAVFLAVLFTHMVLLLIFFGGPKALVSKEPLIRVDHGFHFYYCVIGGKFMLEHGTTWGYDPFLMAGYPTDMVDSSDRPIKVLMSVMAGISPESAYKLTVFAIAAPVPLLFFLAALWFRMNRHAVMTATLLGTAMWWLLGGRSTYEMGMFGFELASTYSFALAGLFYRYLRKPSIPAYAALTFGAALGLLIHAGIVPLIGPPCAVLYLAYFRRLRARTHLFIFLACILAVVANFFWLVPFASNFRHFFATAELPNPFLNNPFQVIKFLKHGMKFVYVMILLLPLLGVLAGAVVAGLLSLRRKGRADLALSIGITSLLFLGVFLLGGSIPFVHKIEPVRFGLPFVFAIVFPASEGLVSWASSIKDVSTRKFTRIIYRLFLAVVVISLLIRFIDVFTRITKKPFVGMDPKLSRVCEWIKANTDRSARVMFEDRSEFLSYFGDTYPAATLAYYTGRELIGGPHWVIWLNTHFVDIQGFMLLGRPLSKWDDKSLAEYMDLYNVGWVGAFSPFMRGFFDQRSALFTPVASFDGVKFYRVNRQRTFFVEGSGTVHAYYNRLVLKNVDAPSGRAVIGYHWHPRLWVAPPAKIVPVTLKDDPAPFVGIVNPAREMTVEINYWGRQ